MTAAGAAGRPSAVDHRWERPPEPPQGDIAASLGIASKTVRNHVANVFNKLQVADRGQAIVRAREAGLGRNTSKR